MVRRLARRVITLSAVFLMVMAVLINSPALFYMATAMVATIAACALQAWLSVRGLRVERLSPPAVNIGEVVTVSMIVWSERRIKRPLIVIRDLLPPRLRIINETPSLPIAPAFDQPVQTRYSFRPIRRGRYKWSRVEIEGTDTLGLITMTREVDAEPAELIVYPAPLPLNLNLRPSGGIGTSEAESGRYRGSGIEPRGIREYQPGDPQRYVHWASSARSKGLMVKEFESGAGLAAYFFLQQTPQSDLGSQGMTSFEAACGHTKYLVDEFNKLGATVEFPSLEPEVKGRPSWDVRRQQIDEILATVMPDSSESLASEVLRTKSRWGGGGTIYLLISIQDAELPGLIAAHRENEWVCLVFDASDFGMVAARNNAAESAFIRQLEGAGAQVHVLPKVTQFREKQTARRRGLFGGVK
ncbi:MAG: DUF58 domain-containing protein [Armatimonadetes bacterium]|nr:DUF58 domain-containing protein [Armatimonadota bacterium]